MNIAGGNIDINHLRMCVAAIYFGLFATKLKNTATNPTLKSLCRLPRRLWTSRTENCTEKNSRRPRRNNFAKVAALPPKKLPPKMTANGYKCPSVAPTRSTSITLNFFILAKSDFVTPKVIEFRPPFYDLIFASCLPKTLEISSSISFFSQENFPAQKPPRRFTEGFFLPRLKVIRKTKKWLSLRGGV